MKKILMSLSVIGVAAAVVIGGTSAFFSDSETSEGNTFTAGAIDLKIDNESYYGMDSDGNMVRSERTTWETAANLDDGEGPADGRYLFFDFHDLKPGDIGEDTISLVVDNNDAWACMDIDITSTPENGMNEPEAEAGDQTDGENEGELQNEVNFVWWVDDGDNVLETDEAETAIIKQSSLAELDETGVAIADSSDNSLHEGPLPGLETFYVGKAWCYGDLALTPVDQDNETENGPDQRGPGVSCDGSGVDNTSQGDGVTADIRFTAVQSRNNDNFTCSGRQDGGDDQERPVVGAALSGYSAPSCNVTVSGDESVQVAIDDASAGDTVCVDASYDNSGDSGYLEVNKENLTIAGLGNAGDATISRGLHIDADGVTITGLTLSGWSLIESSENAAIYINSSISGTTVSYNMIDNAAGGSAKGIVTEIGSGAVTPVSNVAVTHNVLRGWNQAMFFNTTRDYAVTYNDIYGNAVGVANDGPHNASIMNNDFEGNSSEAVGVAPAAANGTGNNGSLAVNVNNFTPAGSGNNVNFYGSSVASGADVDAENNWWDSEVENDRTNNTTEVDTDPAEGSAYPEN